MESNSQINELIVGFLIDDLTDEEHALVVAWINASEENRRYFIQIKDTWQLTAVQLTAQVNEEDEWRLFQNTIAARDSNVVSNNDEEEGGNALIEEQARADKAIVYRRLLRLVATAAAIIILVGLGWMYFLKRDQPPAVATNPLQKVDEVTPVIVREANTTGKEKSIALADGSMVVLFNNSELMYEKHFIRRYIKLTGKAFFKVASDARRPFTVESEGIATTALGTAFTVDANVSAKQKQVIVKLYEGKVVVKPVAANNPMKNEVYLLPGQELVYDSNTTSVRTFETASKSPDVKKEEETPVVDNPTLPVNTKGSWHMYNNQALSQVLDHLAVTYGVSIVYNAKDVQQKYFVGQFKTTDSIELILTLVTKATKLKYTREDNTFIVHQ